jgi:heme/copper-type cytochrome/quinol oxidase subunit 4
MSDSEHPVNFNDYKRRCLYVLFAVACMTAMMIATSFSTLGGESWTPKVALILVIAAVNAFVIAGFLMHLLSEKKLIYTVLAFTLFFFIGLAGLTIWAMNDLPVGSTKH